MKVSGFTFIKNAQKFDYPIVEAINSILPLCDEVVVAVGKSEDETRKIIEELGPKIRIIDTIWDENIREGGKVLAEETNKALNAIDPTSDWAFYIQGDEVIHEQYHEAIAEGMKQYKNDKKVDGLLFNYHHFYGSYNYIADSRNWYRREVRIIRPNQNIKSYKDAQGFRKNGIKLNVKPINATVFHYGWVKDPRLQQSKQQEFSKLWHNDGWVKEKIGDAQEFDYSGIASIARFTGTHPKVMDERLKRLNWELKLDPSRKKHSFKVRVLQWIEKQTSWRIGEFRNYRII